MTKPLRTLVLACAVASAPLAIGATARAEVLHASQWHFTIAFPCRSQIGSQQVDSALGKLVVTMYSCGDDKTYYMAAVVDYPSGSVTPEKVDNGLAAAVDGEANNVQGTIRHVDHYALGDVTGRDAVIDRQDKTVVRSRLFIVGDRLYQVMFMGQTGGEESKGCLDFLNSFALDK